VTIHSAVIATIIAPIAGLLSACNRPERDMGEANRSPPTGLWFEFCDGTRRCTSFGDGTHKIGDTDLALAGCRRQERQAMFEGASADEDAASPAFNWKATVRWGGVFPSGSVVAAVLDCTERSSAAYPFPNVGVLLMPDGFAHTMLDDGDVFIPVDGEATLGHVRATIALEASAGDAATTAATVSVAKAPEVAKTYPGLHVNDAFQWSDRRATIVRILPPQSGTFGVIGWVEVHLSDGDAGDGSVHAQPSAIPRGGRNAG
jgi:hypothetical protein